MSDEDPIRKMQRLSRPALPKRFYTIVSYQAGEGGYAIHLDGKPVRTPKRRPLVLPDEDMARTVAAEWEAQREIIDPPTMPVTRLANVTIDGVADRADEVRAEIVSYAGTDLICYRADEPEGLVKRQEAAWRPLVDWALSALGARLNLAVGVMHVRQDEAALVAVGRAVETFGPFRLAALHGVTTITGSAIIGLALAHGHLDREAGWRAAFVDEDWQASLWGEDSEAAANRARRRREFEAAAYVLRRAGA